MRQPDRPIAALGPAHGVAAIQCSGNDADAIYDVVGSAIRRAREEGGPTLIEVSTYRWLEHCGPNDDIDLGYRGADELAFWRKRDPVARYAAKLRSDGILSDADHGAVQRSIEEEVEAAFSFARASPFPELSELGTYVLPAAAAA